MVRIAIMLSTIIELNYGRSRVRTKSWSCCGANEIIIVVLIDLSTLGFIWMLLRIRPQLTRRAWWNIPGLNRDINWIFLRESRISSSFNSINWERHYTLLDSSISVYLSDDNFFLLISRFPSFFRRLPWYHLLLS